MIHHRIIAAIYTSSKRTVLQGFLNPLPGSIAGYRKLQLPRPFMVVSGCLSSHINFLRIKLASILYLASIIAIRCGPLWHILLTEYRSAAEGGNCFAMAARQPDNQIQVMAAFRHNHRAGILTAPEIYSDRHGLPGGNHGRSLHSHCHRQSLYRHQSSRSCDFRSAPE